MAAGKQTPRQKMINLMYLVFIAMLAMNVDREVLRSFEGVNESLQLSTNLASKNNQTFYDQIEKKKQDGNAGYVEISAKAQEIKRQADEAFSAIEKVKSQLKTDAGYTTPQPDVETDYKSLQNTDVVNKVFFISDNKPTPEVATMISKVQGFTKFILQGASSGAKDRINQLFDFSGKGKKSWLVEQFYDQPMISALTNLTRLEANIRTEEGNIVRDLLSNKLQDEIELKAFVPIVASPKYVKSGERFDVVVGFGAYDTSLKGSITLNGQNVALNGGKAVVGMTAGGAGVHTLSGSITYITPDGKSKIENFNEKYEVVAETMKTTDGSAVVMADKMNVVYRGVDNPLSAAVNGIEPSSLSLQASSGSLSRAGSGWSYRPGAGTSVTFTVSGKTSSGKAISKQYNYRIKNVPKAQGEVRGSNVVNVSAGALAAQTISANIPDFEFPVSISVTGFSVKVSGQPTVTVSGNKLSAAGGVLSKARSGDQVLIFNIKATVSGVSQSSVSPVVINVL
ncbi:gliding motility protein GldM [Apibacter raozihei]|uniref:type IX secretion system motor protein PorM/GldM n=1 Tax=Apibacter raozihei TaxID=2500547 RepID=UPI000FE3C281|nr:gliding motility protein GldM [Apibacter raozihei]